MSLFVDVGNINLILENFYLLIGDIVVSDTDIYI